MLRCEFNLIKWFEIAKSKYYNKIIDKKVIIIINKETKSINIADYSREYGIKI